MKKIIYVVVDNEDNELLRAFFDKEEAKAYAKDFNDVGIYSVRIEEVEFYEI